MSKKIDELLRSEVQQFLRSNEQADEAALVLKYQHVLGVPVAWIAEQLSGRRKAKQKLPSWYRTESVIYPPPLSLAQCSSEATAQFKAGILADLPLVRGVDLTGGFGVDSFFISQRCSDFTYVEPSGALFEIAMHNHHRLGAPGIKGAQQFAGDFLRSSGEPFDLIFLDPSRRKKGRKIFQLADGEPSVPNLLHEIFNHANMLLLKTSPMLDLRQGLSELRHVETIFVVSVDNECRELLFLCRKDYTSDPKIHCVNLSVNRYPGEALVFHFAEEKKATPTFSDPLNYVYEPNASILKAGAFKLVCERYRVSKLHPHTHFYTSAELLGDFPGRIFRIEGPWSPGRDSRQANILSRNYPLSSDQLKVKLKITDGGERYLLACSGIKHKFLLDARRIK